MQNFLLDLFELSDTDIAYLAGVFDGEGHISVLKDKRGHNAYSLHLIINITSLETVYRFRDSFGGTVGANTSENNKRKGKPIYRWVVCGKRAESVLRTLFPYLHIKRKEAEIVFQIRSYWHSMHGEAKKHLVAQLLEERHK